jgi:hypothetical protein
LSGFEPGAFGLKSMTGHLIQKGFGHLASTAVMHAYEKNTDFLGTRRRHHQPLSLSLPIWLNSGRK